MFPITTLYAIPLGALALILAAAVIAQRAKTGISIGHGEDVTLHERIRRHANLTEGAPIFLILLALAEAGGTPSLWLHLTGVAAVAGRLLHAQGLKADAPTAPGRIIGASLGLGATLSCLAALARIAI